MTLLDSYEFPWFCHKRAPNSLFHCGVVPLLRLGRLGAGGVPLLR
eukprot:SAG22_NODE_11921_length_463_cov_1.258242_1_plen_44_part_10